jgi:hypothetical protein
MSKPIKGVRMPTLPTYATSKDFSQFPEKSVPLIKTIAEKAISYFPMTGDVIQAYADAGSKCVHEFISNKDKYKDFMSMIIHKKSGNLPTRDQGVKQSLYSVIDNGSELQMFPERGDIVVSCPNFTGERRYFMVCDYIFGVGVRVYDYSDKSNPDIVGFPNFDAVIRILE